MRRGRRRPDRRLPDRAAGQGRDRRRARRPGAQTVRARAEPCHAPSGPCIDTCGTGGGRLRRFNISTTATFVVGGRRRAGGQARQPLVHLQERAAPTCWRRWARASTSTPTASRAASRRPASASCSRRRTTRRSGTSCRSAGRSGVRTVFNLLGPLTNPAGAPRQLLGVADPAYLERWPRRSAMLGSERALIVHGRDGMDELSTAAVSDVVEVSGRRSRACDHRSRPSSGFGPPRTATSRAATRPTTPRCCARCWRARRGRRATWWC